MTRILIEDGLVDAAMIRRWAYDPDALLLDQDEDLVLFEFAFIPVLLELAADPACPKRDDILCSLDDFLRGHILYQRAPDLAAVADAVRLAARYESVPPIAAWRAVQVRRLDCLTERRSVMIAEALRMGDTLLRGLARSGCIVAVRAETPATIELELSVPHGAHREWLSIDRATGCFRYARCWFDGAAEPSWIEPTG